MRARREALRFLRSPVPTVVSFDESEWLAEITRQGSKVPVALRRHRDMVASHNRRFGAPIERRKAR